MRSATARTHDVVLAGLFAALTAVGAFVRLPLEPVPFTLQPLVVFLSGVLLRPRAALLAQLVYIAVGLAGLPVFANGGGPAYVLQPTFGFVVGFAAAAWTVATLLGRRAAVPVWRTAGSVLAGLAVMYGCGVAGLYLNLALFQGKPAVFSKIVWGLGGFLVFDLVKAVLVAALAPALRRALPGQDDAAAEPLPAERSC